jgi:prepilin-type processing-associated H-X9-DG protein
VHATVALDHAHATDWFSALNKDWEIVDDVVKAEIQPDRHFQSANYLYADGHVETLPASQIDEWIGADFDFARPE